MIVGMRTRKAYQVNYERLQKSVKHIFLLCFCCATLGTLENTVIPAGVSRAFFLLRSITAEYVSSLSWQKDHHAVQS